MQLNPIVIIGSGMEARITLDIFNENDVLAYGFIAEFEDFKGKLVNDITAFGTLEDEDVRKVLKDSKVDYIVSVGDIDLRKKLYLEAHDITRKPAVNAIHKMSFISNYAKVGFGNTLNAGVIINPNVMVEDHNIFHSNVSVEPDTHIGSYCTFSSGVVIGANVTILDKVFIGTGAVIHPGVTLGKGAIIAAGSVVLQSVANGKQVFGVPAVEI